MNDTVDLTLLETLHHATVELARLGGAEITHALGRSLAVRYKTDRPDEHILRDPVSDADVKVEKMIREYVERHFPDHAVLGEEMGADTLAEREYVWAIDPIDGTSNFVNGFPLFACSIGVLRHGLPVVGAVWCATTHALRAGVYHAQAGGPIYFDEDRIERRTNPTVRRLLVGEPDPIRGEAAAWEGRKTGSAAIECAFVAAGLLRAARFEHPNVWDIGGGIALVLAAGHEVRQRNGGGWARLDSFGAAMKELQSWNGDLAIGEPHALNLICAQA
jgi:myo-inositol-1(or 4)-monophosphatase